MTTASPEQAKSLQGELESSKEAAKRISSGETRTSETGQATRTKPSARVSGGPVDASDAASARQSGRVRTGTDTPLSDLPKADTAEVTPAKRAELKNFRNKPSQPSAGKGESKRAAALNQAVKDGANKPSTSPRSRGRNLLDRLLRPKGRRATRILGAAEGQAAKPTGSLRSGNLSFPGDRSGAYAAAKAKVKDAPLSRRGMRAPGGVSSAKPAPAKPASTAKPAPAKPAPVKQSEVSKTIKKRLLSLKSTREAKPTAAQLKQFRLGQTKGYIGKTGTPTAQGIQTYTTRRATRGFGDAGYDAAKRGVKDPLASSRNVNDIVKRAAAGDKLARREVKKSYKAMTRRYKDIVPSAKRTQAGMASVRSGLENTYNAPSATRPPSATPPPKPPKLDDTPKSSRLPAGRSKGGGTSTGGSRGGAAVLTPTKPPKTITKIAAPPTPKTPTGPKVTSNTGGKLADTIAPNLVKQARQRIKGDVKPPPIREPKPYRGAGVGSKVTVGSGKAVGTSQIVPYTPPKSPSKGKTATVTDLSDAGFAKGRPGTRTYSPSIAKASKVKNALRGAGRVLGPAAAIADVGLTYKDARDAGYTRGQSVKRTAAQVGSGSAGGWAGAKAGALTGAKIGAFLGLKGAAIGAGIGGIVGGIGGYMAGRGLATKVLDKTMKPKEYRPKVNQQQVQNTANNVKNNTFTPKVNPTTGQRYIGDKDIKRLGLKTAAEIQNIKKPKPKIKKASIPLNASFSPLEEYILETSDAMLKSGYTIDETVDFWTIEDEDLVEKVLSSLTLTESVSYDDDLYVVCERVGALRSLGSWALKQASRLKGAFSRGSGSTVNVTRSQTRGGIFNTGILKKIFKPKVQVTGRGIQKPPRKLGTAGKIGALGALGLGLGLAGKSIYDAENRDPIKSNIEVDPDGEVKAGPESNPNTPTAQGWWKKSHYGNPVQQIPYRYNKHTQKLNSSGNVVNK